MVKEFNQRMRGLRRVGKREGPQGRFRYPNLAEFAHFMLPSCCLMRIILLMDESEWTSVMESEVGIWGNDYINISPVSLAFLSFKMGKFNQECLITCSCCLVLC